MKNILFSTIICLLGFFSIGQLTANGNSGASTTAYTNGSPNDPIYIWCADGLANNTASLTATPPSGTGPFTFDWYYHNQTTSSWSNYSTNVGATSTISNLPSDGYKVQIYDNVGTLIVCYNAWVWNMNSEVTVSETATACDATNLNGAISLNGSFTYYNPPPPESLITPTTAISVCFSATHTYVSDLAFYLVGPPSCGSPRILLSPNPGANGQNNICNSGDNVSNLCFSNGSVNNLNVCTASTPLTGTYGSYGATPTFINWAPLIGCNAAQGGWAVQIYDCIGADVGSLTNSTISFSNLGTECGSSPNITYTSGTINSAINDNSCTAGSASIFQVPVSTVLSTPIVINATSSYQWTSNPVVAIPNSTSSLTPSVTGLADGSTMFYLTGSFSYGTANCTNVDSVEFITTCCSVTADAGSNVSFCSGSNSIIGTPAQPGITYSWSPSTGLNNANTAQPTVSGTIAGPGSQVTTYTLTVTDVANGGCTDVSTVDVTILPPAISNAGANVAFCSGGSSLIGSSSNAGMTYSWSPSTGLSNPNIAQPTVTGTNAGPGSQVTTYTLTVTNTGNGGCTAVSTVDVTIYPAVVADAGQDVSFCSGFNSQIGTASQAGLTYSWSPSSGLNDSNIAQPTASGTNVGPGSQVTTYTLTVSNAACSSTNDVNVTIYPITTVDAGTYSPICADAGDITLVGSPTGGTFSGVGVSANLFNSSNGTQTVTYTYVDGNNCTFSENAIITVNPLPNVNAGVDQTVCEGQSVTLGGTGALNYTWSNGVQNNQPFTPSAGQVTYTVTGTDVNGCVNTDNVVVNVFAVPDANVLADVNSGYPGLVVNFANNSTNSSNFNWNFGNGETGLTNSLASTTSTYLNPGTYDVVLTAMNGSCTDYDTVQVIIIEFPEPIIEVPNVFSPNGDGANDNFFINVQFATSIHFIIINRWGNLIFENEGVNPVWDGDSKGNPVEEGVFFVKYEITGINGNIYPGHGNVTLIRD